MKINKFYKNVRRCYIRKSVDELRRGGTTHNSLLGGGNDFVYHSYIMPFTAGRKFGGGEGFGRGTHYIYWGQGNLRFATMRLKGEKGEKEKKEKKEKTRE